MAPRRLSETKIDRGGHALATRLVSWPRTPRAKPCEKQMFSTRLRRAESGAPRPSSSSTAAVAVEMIIFTRPRSRSRRPMAADGLFQPPTAAFGQPGDRPEGLFSGSSANSHSRPRKDPSPPEPRFQRAHAPTKRLNSIAAFGVGIRVRYAGRRTGSGPRITQIGSTEEPHPGPARPWKEATNAGLHADASRP